MIITERNFSEIMQGFITNEINAILTGNQQFEQQSKKQYNGMFR